MGKSLVKKPNETTFRRLVKGADLKKHIEYILKMAEKDWLKGLEKNGFSHSRRIERNLDRLVPARAKESMPLGEIYLLLCAAYLHDVGYKIDSRDHIKCGADDILHNYRKYGFSDRYIAKAVSWICSRHGPEKDYPIHKGNRGTIIAGISQDPLDLPFIAGLLRIADEVDNVYVRAPGKDYPSEDLRYLIQGVYVNVSHWLIEFQLDTVTNSFQWRKLCSMRKYVQERLNDLLDIFESRKLHYHKHSVITNPDRDPLTQQAQENFGQRPLDPSFSQIIADLEPDIKTLWDYVDATQGQEFDDTKFLGGNALTLLRLLGEDFRGKDLSRTVLTNADLSYADLAGVNLNQAILKNANMKYTVLKNAILTKANIEGTTFDGPDEIFDLAWSPDGSFVAIAGKDQTVRIIETETFTEMVKFVGHKNIVNCVSWYSGSDELISGSMDDTVRFLDLKKRICLEMFPCHIGGVRKLQVAKDGREMMCLGRDDKFQVWDLQEKESRKLQPEMNQITSMVSTPNLEFTFIGSLNGTVGVLSRKDEYAFEVVARLPAPVGCLSLASDRKLLYAGCKDGKIRNLSLDWKNASSGTVHEMTGIYSHRGPIRSLALSLNNQLLASGSDDYKIILWDTGECESIDALVGHDGFVDSVTFSPKGNLLASGGTDRNVRIWNLNPESENMGELVRCLGSDCSGMKFEGVIGMDENTRKFFLKRKAEVPRTNIQP